MTHAVHPRVIIDDAVVESGQGGVARSRKSHVERERAAVRNFRVRGGERQESGHLLHYLCHRYDLRRKSAHLIKKPFERIVQLARSQTFLVNLRCGFRCVAPNESSTLSILHKKGVPFVERFKPWNRDEG